MFPTTHSCDAIVVTCIDFRFQKYIKDWLDTNLGDHAYDRVSLAGSIFDFPAILKQVEISNRLHHIQKVILINHEECGAYGDQSTYKRHNHDLTQAKKQLTAQFPHLAVQLYYLHKDGTFEQVS